jgi:hypothetical protein
MSKELEKIINKIIRGNVHNIKINNNVYKPDLWQFKKKGLDKASKDIASLFDIRGANQINPPT